MPAYMCKLCLHCNWTYTILEYNMYTCVHTDWYCTCMAKHIITLNLCTCILFDLAPQGASDSVFYLQCSSVLISACVTLASVKRISFESLVLI